jgi:hypothetical protein
VGVILDPGTDLITTNLDTINGYTFTWSKGTHGAFWGPSLAWVTRTSFDITAPWTFMFKYWPDPNTDYLLHLSFNAPESAVTSPPLTGWGNHIFRVRPVSFFSPEGDTWASVDDSGAVSADINLAQSGCIVAVSYRNSRYEVHTWLNDGSFHGSAYTRTTTPTVGRIPFYTYSNTYNSRNNFDKVIYDDTATPTCAHHL